MSGQRLEDEESNRDLWRRKAAVLEKINKRKKQNEQGAATSKQMRYHNVVDEVQIDFTNVFDVALRLFRPGRKLKPAVRAKQAQAVESVREAKLLVHVIRATDVPLRLSYYKEYEDYLAAG